jgi:hypothetical protein
MDTQSTLQKIPESKQETNEKQEGILSASFGLSSEFIKFLYTIGLTETMKILNFFLSNIKTQIENFVPNEQDKNNAINENASLLQAIEIIVKDPVFQQKWRDFSEQIAQLLKILLERIVDVTENEAETIMNNIMNLVEKNASTFVNGLGMGIMEGVCALPPLVPFCELAIVVGTGSKLTSQTFLTMMETTTKLAEAFSKILGDTAEPIVETIETIQGFIDYIKNIQNTISSSVVSGMNNVQNTLQTYQQPTQQPRQQQTQQQTGGEKKYLKKNNKTSKRQKSKKQLQTHTKSHNKTSKNIKV